MKHDMDALRAQLTAARQEYRDDLKLLRTRYGITPELRLEHVYGVLLHALNTLESEDPAALEAAVKAFKKLHRGMMQAVTWEYLEQTKQALQRIRKKNPQVFQQKLSLWNQASACFTNFNLPPGQSITLNYRKALKHLEGL